VARAEAPVARAEAPVAKTEVAVANAEQRVQSKTEPRAPKPSTGSEPEADNGGRVSKSSGRAGKQRHDSRPSAPPSGPFGEHVPAFMLRRVRHVAGA
jgi:hypothetical protein